MIRRFSLLIIFCVAVCDIGWSQGVEFVARLNFGIGLSYDRLDYLGNDVYYSPGGGSGFELGVVVPYGALEAYFMGGLQQNLAIQSETTTTGGVHESSFFFNRKSLLTGVNYKLYLWDRTFTGFKIGGGVNYNFPGNYRTTENNNTLQNITYRAAAGYHLGVDIVLQFPKFTLAPGLRYRSMAYKARSQEFGDVSDLTGDLRRLDASGIDISVSILKTF